MDRPGTFYPEKMKGLPETKHHDAWTMHYAIANSKGCRRAQALAQVFGVVPNQRNNTKHAVYTIDTVHIIDDSLAGMSPELSHKIWETIYKEASKYGILISKMDYDMILSMDTDPGTAILMALINQAGDPFNLDAVQIINQDGSGRMWLDVCKNDDEIQFLRANTVTLARNISWSHDQIVVSGIPETIISVLPGRPLADLIIHPLLAELNLEITGVEDLCDNIYSIKLNYEPEFLELRKLAALETAKHWRLRDKNPKTTEKFSTLSF